MRATRLAFVLPLLLQPACGRSSGESPSAHASATVPVSAARSSEPSPAASAPPARDLLSDLTDSFGGDRAKANAELKTLVAVSDASGYGLAHVADLYMDLEPLRKRYSENATLDVLAALLDIETRSGKKAADSVKYSLDNAARTDHWDPDATRTFEMSGVGNSDEFAAMIAVARKTTLANAQLAALSGRITSAEGINAFLQLVRKNLDNGGALGAMAHGARQLTDGGTR